MSHLWLNWLFQNRIDKPCEGDLSYTFREDSIGFEVSLTLLDVSLFNSSLKEEDFEVCIVYYPDADEIELDLWNNTLTCSFFGSLEQEPERISCSYRTFMGHLKWIALKAAKHWGN